MFKITPTPVRNNNNKIMKLCQWNGKLGPYLYISWANLKMWNIFQILSLQTPTTPLFQ